MIDRARWERERASFPPWVVGFFDFLVDNPELAHRATDEEQRKADLADAYLAGWDAATKENRIGNR